MAKAENYKTDQFALIMTRKHFSSDKTWSRVFGPFKTRSKATTFKNKQIRHLINDEYYTQERIKREFKWQIVGLWTPIDKPTEE